MNSTGIIIGWIITGATAIGGLITAIVTRRKVSAEAEAVTVTTMELVIKRLHDELQVVVTENETHEARLQELEHERNSLRLSVTRLENRIARLESWIRHNTATDPADINGHPV